MRLSSSCNVAAIQRLLGGGFKKSWKQSAGRPSLSSILALIVRMVSLARSTSKVMVLRDILTKIGSKVMPCAVSHFEFGNDFTVSFRAWISLCAEFRNLGEPKPHALFAHKRAGTFALRRGNCLDLRPAGFWVTRRGHFPAGGYRRCLWLGWVVGDIVLTRGGG